MKRDQNFLKDFPLKCKIFRESESINQVFYSKRARGARGARGGFTRGQAETVNEAKQIEKFNCNLHKILVIVALGICFSAQLGESGIVSCDTPTRFLCRF